MHQNKPSYNSAYYPHLSGSQNSVVSVVT